MFYFHHPFREGKPCSNQMWKARSWKVQSATHLGPASQGALPPQKAWPALCGPPLPVPAAPAQQFKLSCEDRGTGRVWITPPKDENLLILKQGQDETCENKMTQPPPPRVASASSVTPPIRAPLRGKGTPDTSRLSTWIHPSVCAKVGRSVT